MHSKNVVGPSLWDWKYGCKNRWRFSRMGESLLLLLLFRLFTHSFTRLLARLVTATANIPLHGFRLWHSDCSSMHCIDSDTQIHSSLVLYANITLSIDLCAIQAFSSAVYCIQSVGSIFISIHRMTWILMAFVAVCVCFCANCSHRVPQWCWYSIFLLNRAWICIIVRDM